MVANQVVFQSENAGAGEHHAGARIHQCAPHEDLSLSAVAQAAHMRQDVLFLQAIQEGDRGETLRSISAGCGSRKQRSNCSNPMRGISEVAYEVGFQSLTHFNRVFKNSS